ncbi:MAG: sulfite exporter TauE/SafE family protein [Rubrivivax sp.]|nr:sulfite exporter TauE/SafE family protein [Rubrivivax sp.]MDP3612535.1 sulfite exporter TauE/SafE family protein [Rubrivivax sp.]
MDAALITGAALLGLAGTPHCAAMCGAPCAAVCGKDKPVNTLAFQLARVAGYATAGAVAAASVGALSSLAQLSPALRPLWAVLHALLLTLGLWLLWRGRQPAWMGQVGRVPATAPATAAATGGQGAGGWSPMLGPARAVAAGGLWVAWPCGLLQSALLLASLTGDAAAGAGAMAAFAVASSGGLLLAPWAWRWMSRSGKGPRFERLLVRGAGVLLVLGSSFALGAGVWHQIADFCGLS